MKRNRIHREPVREVRDPVHWYWAFDKPQLLIGLGTGASLCGEYGILKKNLTTIASAVTCRACKKRKLAREQQTLHDAEKLPEISVNALQKTKQRTRIVARHKPASKKHKR